MEVVTNGSSFIIDSFIPEPDKFGIEELSFSTTISKLEWDGTQYNHTS